MHWQLFSFTEARKYSVRGEMYGLSDIYAQRDSDGLSLLRTLEKAVKGVAGFPGDGETMYWILLFMMEGKNQEETLSIMDLGRQALARHTARAVNLLSFVLWGYSTMQILNGIVLTPFAKGSADNLNTGNRKYKKLRKMQLKPEKLLGTLGGFFYIIYADENMTCIKNVGSSNKKLFLNNIATFITMWYKMLGIKNNKRISN